MVPIEEKFNIYLVPEPYRSALPPTPSPAPDLIWLNAVRRDIEKISKSKVGSALLNSIKYHGVVITIQPMQPGVCDDNTWPIEDDLHTGVPSLSITEGPNIWFSPEQHSLDSQCEARHKVFGQLHIQSDEVLLHELVHALRMVSFKRAATRPVIGKGLALYGDTEEFIAVLVQGIYASELGRGVRASHTRHFPIDERLKGSFEFFQSGSETFKLIKQFCVDNPGFTRALSCIETRFNPLRAYYSDPGKAARMSTTRLARDRDKFQPLIKDGYDLLRKSFIAAGIIDR